MSPQLSPIKVDLKRCFDEVAKLTADQMEIRQSMQAQVSALEDKICLLQTVSENRFQSLLNKID